MPVKDLRGPPRPSAAERALMREIEAHVARLRRDHPDDDDAIPAIPPGGPLPMAGGAAAEPDA